MNAPFEDINDNSIVFRLDFKGTSILFTGDITDVAEKTLLEKNIDVDILKVPHHGSKYSSTNEFLEKTSPKLAIIPLGRDNSFNFPHKETLERLKKNGIKYYRTDRDGAIEVIIGEKNTNIMTYLD